MLQHGKGGQCGDELPVEPGWTMNGCVGLETDVAFVWEFAGETPIASVVVEVGTRLSGSGIPLGGRKGVSRRRVGCGCDGISLNRGAQ